MNFIKIIYLSAFLILNTTIFPMQNILSSSDTTSGYAYFPLGGGQCGLLEHDASTGMKDNANISEFSRQGVDCISMGSYYSSLDWSGNGVLNPDKYLYFMIGPLTVDNIMVLRKQDRLSFKAMRNGPAPDTIAVYFVDRYGNHTLLIKTFLPDQEWKSFVTELPVTFIPVISSIRFYAWGSAASQSGIVPGILSVDDVQISFGITSAASTDLEEIQLPESFKLYDAYPNPFNPSTTIQFRIDKPGMVRLQVYNTLGNEVSVIVNEFRERGIYSEKFDAGSLASGIYYYRLTAGNHLETRKMLLIK